MRLLWAVGLTLSLSKGEGSLLWAGRADLMRP